MWMIELATKTITADSRIGSHNDMSGTIGTSSSGWLLAAAILRARP
jgi:hypothetical protein